MKILYRLIWRIFFLNAVQCDFCLVVTLEKNLFALWDSYIGLWANILECIIFFEDSPLFCNEIESSSTTFSVVLAM